MAKDDADILLAAARAVERLGQAEFYDCLLDVLGAVTAHDLVALVRYSRTAPPDLILPRVEPNEALQAYHQYFFALDPFYTHWMGGGDIGVYRLRALATDIGRSRYAREFLSAMAIHDEIAVFLPAIGEASPTLILDRARRPFTDVELAQVKRLFPLLSELHRQHIEIFVAAGSDNRGSPLGQQHLLRLLDQHGVEIFATRAWREVAELDDPTLAEALAVIAARGPCALPLSDGRLLRRTRLAPGFGPAPNGFCDEIAPGPTAVAGLGSSLPPQLSESLTEREQEVVLLTLQGYPVIEIARRLGLSRGTVKNYRLSIYRKLDITSERELFKEYLTATHGQHLQM